MPETTVAGTVSNTPGTTTSTNATDAATDAFFARYKPLSATVTRIGNSCGGTTLETRIWGKTKKFPDGSPIRLALPPVADRVGLEWSADGKTVMIRVQSSWNEGGWQQSYFLPDGTAIGGMFDVGFPRQDVENKTPANAYAFGTGFWMDNGVPSGDDKYRAGLPFVELKRDAPPGDSGYPGYSWKSDAGGVVITTPKTTLFGLIPLETVVTDPANPNLVFSLSNSFVLNWNKRGNGREQASFTPSFDWSKYPTDPRRTPATNTHPGPLGAFRLGDDLYLYFGDQEVLLHRWDAAAKVLIPVAALYARPDQLPASIPGAPSIGWGQGAICRADNTGNFTADRWQVYDASILAQRGSSYVKVIDPANGDLLLLPQWTKPEDANPVTVWKTFDLVRGVFSPDNVTTIPLPDALKSAGQCEQVRIDWATGDLFAVVQRNGQWSLERYPAWRTAKDRASVTAVYSVGPIALSVRREFPWWAKWSDKWGCTTDPTAGVMSAGFGTMALSPDGLYLFIAEAQSDGLRVHRVSDGKIVGRVADRLHPRSTLDNPTQISVTQTASEYRIFLMDFNGKSVCVWRISSRVLAAAAKA